jgi:hypothetical protein
MSDASSPGAAEFFAWALITAGFEFATLTGASGAADSICENYTAMSFHIERICNHCDEYLIVKGCCFYRCDNGLVFSDDKLFAA